MNRDEALSILREQVLSLRTRPYEDLLQYLGNAVSSEVCGPSGREYQVEVDAVWDNGPKSDLHVLVSIDDGSLRWSFSPITDSFIIRPDGSFVGE